MKASPIYKKEDHVQLFGAINEAETKVQQVLASDKKRLNDYEILSGLRKGDESVLGYVYSQYSKSLFRFGLQYTTDQDLIKDSIHDVFVNLMNSQKTLQKIQSIKAYLFTSLYRRIVYYLNRRKYLDIKVSESNQFPIAFDPELSMGMDEDRKKQLDKVKAGIEQLSKKQRQAILHYYSDGFSHQEIAQIMGIRNTNSVAKLIARGLGAVRSFVQKFEGAKLSVLLLLTYLLQYLG